MRTKVKPEVAVTSVPIQVNTFSKIFVWNTKRVHYDQELEQALEMLIKHNDTKKQCS